MRSFSGVFHVTKNTVIADIGKLIGWYRIPLATTVMSSVYQDPFAKCKNLMLLWPMDLPKVLHDRVARACTAGYRLAAEADRASDNDVKLESELFGKGGMREVASFPCLYEAGLVLIMRKWDFYTRMYIEMRQQDVRGAPDDRVIWKTDLLDSWGRHILFIERVLEAAIQWSKGDRGSICHVLRLFLAQEAKNTVHTLKTAKAYNISHDDDAALRTCEYISCPHGMPLTPACIQRYTNGR